MPDDRKVFDIARPTATATARPVIPAGPLMPDPMVTVQPPTPARSIPLKVADEEEEETAVAVPPPAAPTAAESKPPEEPAPAPTPTDTGLTEEPKPEISNIPVSEAPDEPPAVQAASTNELASGTITPALPGAPEASFASVPKFGELQAKIDAHPLFSGQKDRRVKVRRLPRFFWPFFILLVLLALAYLTIDAGLVRGASHLPFHVFKQDAPVASTPAITPTTQAKSPASTSTPKPVTKFATWTKYTSPAFGYSFSYPADYGSLAAGTVGNKDIADVLVNSQPKVGLAHVDGTYTINDYKTATVAIPTYQYGPSIELQNGKWIVTTANASDFNGYKVGQTFKDISTVKNSQGQSIYTMVSSYQGVSAYIIIFVSGNSLHTITLPGFTVQSIGSSGSNDQTYYDAMFRQVRSSITVKP